MPAVAASIDPIPACLSRLSSLDSIASPNSVFRGIQPLKMSASVQVLLLLRESNVVVRQRVGLRLLP